MVHEHMHERTSEERQPDEQAEDMGAVLGEQKRAGNNGEPDKDKSRSRG